ncbi:alpha/beta hydrolase [Lignipirellula cremea]|uniref:Acetylxylan esterase n=1 Tax=Lignipirellula cremea TaxID=2528010 RepID=A0A518DYB6_9BACT|nr:alpha/beta hydrolase [Lignipirellula cremea]QDU96838.1 Acetylxylan esterase precursor [Lignipirellula cremea]
MLCPLIRTFAPLLLLAIPLLAVQGVENKPMKLWPGDAPGESGKIGPEGEMPGRPGQKQVIRLANVSEPTLTVFRPPADKANGCAVLIAPGGGYSILAWDLEGTEVAEWLNSIGVTAVLLKYRVPRRDKDAPHAAPLADAQRALRLTRQHAEEWGIDPDRLGMLGFSAGGHLTAVAGTNYDKTSYAKVDAADELSCRPDFIIPIYPAYLADESQPNNLQPLLAVNENTPPAFIAVTQDDADRGLGAAYLFIALKKAKVVAELHIYSQGGHGYGLRESSNPVSTWHDRCGEWMKVNGLLEAKK